MTARVPGAIVSIDLIKACVQSPNLPGIIEQSENLIVWVGDETEGEPAGAKMKPATHQFVIGSPNPETYSLVLEELVRQRVLTMPIANVYALTFEGRVRYEELKRGRSNSRKAFMAMKYGDSELDRVVETCFRPAVEATGFRLFVLSDELKAGLIDDRMRVEIRTSRFQIADLTHDNNGAYWEAGFAEGLGRPEIYTCEAGKFREKPPHFDANHLHTILWALDDLSTAADRLKATIRNTLSDEAQMTDAG